MNDQTRRRQRGPVQRKPPRVAKTRPPAERTRALWLAASGTVVTVVAVIVVVDLTGSSKSAPSLAAMPSLDDRDASKSLVVAAGAVGLHPTIEPVVGKMEGKPASDAQWPLNPNRSDGEQPDVALRLELQQAAVDD